jgi:hypothetical protein
MPIASYRHDVEFCLQDVPQLLSDVSMIFREHNP